MSTPYRLKTAIDENGNVDGDDVLAVKTALQSIGYYEAPEWGISPYPDRAMFDAIGAFQVDHQLVRDQVMKPGGPTEKELAARSPVYRCPKCGAPHGGSAGRLCPDCAKKES